MQLVDTHTHLYDKAFRGDLPDVIGRAVQEGVSKMYLPAVDSESHPAMLDLEAAYPDHFRSMMGLHPCSVTGHHGPEMKLVEDWLGRRRFAAIGEIGLDYYWDKTHIQEQQDVFRKQIAWARDLGLPIVIHSRNSMDDCIRLVGEEKDDRLTGIFHCFTGTKEQAEAITELGFFLGIGGVLTYKNSPLPSVLADFPLDHVVLETDAPYLTPVPFRGRRNESSYIKYVAEKLAGIKNISVTEIASISTVNAEKVFGSWA